MLAVFDALGVYLRAAGFTGVNYKAVPYIYHSQPADEDIYALFRHGAQAVRTDVSATIAVPRRLPFGSGKKDGLRKARKAGLEIRESTDWSACWTLLTQVLDDRHNARPVHSEAEIRLLAARFPDQIRMLPASSSGRTTPWLMIQIARCASTKRLPKVEETVSIGNRGSGRPCSRNTRSTNGRIIDPSDGISTG